MKKYCIILVLLAFSSVSFSQTYFGGEIGYYQSKEFIKGTYILSGIRFEKKFPDKAAISIEELVEKFSQNSSYYDRSATYLKTVIGFDLNIGNKIYLLLGVGVAPKILIQNKDYASNPKSFILDGKLNIGIGYHLSPKLFTSLSCQYHFNITPYNIYNWPDHFGGSTPYKEYNKQLFLQLNINYILNLSSTKE